MPQPGLQQPGGQSSIAVPSLLLPGDARGFTPASLPGLVLWLDAGGLGQPDNTAVPRWTDLSGQGNDATQGTVAHQPTYLAAGLNGHPALSFDGVDDYLFLSPIISEPLSMFAVASNTAGGASGFRAILSVKASLLLTQTNVANAWGLYTDVAHTSGSPVAPSGSVLSAVLSSPNVLLMATNGSVTSGSGTTWLNGASSLVGANPGAGPGHWHQGTIATLLVYSRVLTTAERHTLEAYLSIRYRIPVVQQ